MPKWPVNWELRTSKTHPIGVDWITHSSFKGSIGITLCPGKYQPTSWSGGWNRDLDCDVELLAMSGASTIISLVEFHEMDELRVPNLGEVIQKNGMKWIHLPFRDTTVPSDKWLRSFANVGQGILQSIQNGDSIIVHCKGGLSRAGVLVSIILFLLGFKMQDAISLIRKTRSAVCINFQQEGFLMSLFEPFIMKIID